MTDHSALLADPSQNLGADLLATLVLDRSGSMSSVRDDTIGGVNQWLDGLIASAPRTRVTIILFDHEYQVLYDSVELVNPDTGERNIPPFDTTTYVPRGSTALLDAVNKALMVADSRKGANDSSLFVIVTDGDENASREVRDANVIKEMIEERTQNQTHSFAFLNASPDRFLGNKLGLGAEVTLRYQGGDAGQTQQAFASITRSSVNYSTQSLESRRSLSSVLAGEKLDLTNEADNLSPTITSKTATLSSVS